MSRHCESLGGLALSVQQTSSEELNPFEMEIVSKFDSILTLLRELEEHFCQVRQEVLRKSTLEGKENAKIFAIKGRVITNRKKYYRSLESDIQNLDKVVQEQLSKVLRDFTSLKVVSGLEEKTGAELTPNKDLATFTPLLNSHAAELHIQQDIIGSSPFVKSVALPSLKRVDNGKKPINMAISRPVTRPLFKASSTTEVEVPKKLDFDRPDSIPNPYGSRLLRRQQQQAEVLQIPEDPEGEEFSRGAVSRVRLGLLNEIKSSEAVQVSKPVRAIRGHGFKIAQATPSKDQLNHSPPEDHDKCTI